MLPSYKEILQAKQYELRADLRVEGGQEIVDEDVLLPQILLQRIHQLTSLQHSPQSLQHRSGMNISGHGV